MGLENVEVPVEGYNGCRDRSRIFRNGPQRLVACADGSGVGLEGDK